MESFRPPSPSPSWCCCCFLSKFRPLSPDREKQKVPGSCSCLLSRWRYLDFCSVIVCHGRSRGRGREEGRKAGRREEEQENKKDDMSLSSEANRVMVHSFLTL